MLRDLEATAGAPEPRSLPPGRSEPRAHSAVRPTRLAEREFLRPGGMFRRYYNEADLRALAQDASLVVDELRYCCVRLENKRRSLVMDRVFLHGVLSKPAHRDD